MKTFSYCLWRKDLINTYFYTAFDTMNLTQEDIYACF